METDQIGYTVDVLCRVVYGVLLADFGSGIVHWLDDRYWGEGDGIFPSSRNHHADTRGFGQKSYYYRNSAAVALGGIIILARLVAYGITDFWIFAGVTLLLSQANQVHTWAHRDLQRNPLPPPVRWAQRYGLLQSGKHHAQHHVLPYRKNYCMLTNYLNPMLDLLCFFAGCERLLKVVGIKPLDTPK